MIEPMSEPPVLEFLKLAQRLAREAGRIANAPGGPTRVSRKTDDSLVTETDHAIQRHILQAIAEVYPDHAVCAEETVAQPDAHADRTKARYCWVIDPLDGTRNYAAGLPCFSTSIAVLDRGEPMVGVVAEHNLGHVYSVVRSGGAKLNDKAIRVTDPNPQRDLLIGIPSTKDELTVRILQSWVAKKRFILRDLGSTAFHLGLVASGALNAAFCNRCKIWDIAAGMLLVTEAGGLITNPFGKPLTPFDLTADPNVDAPYLASSAALHERLVKLIKQIAS